MPLYLKMSENINETTRHLKFRYISILINLLQTLEDNSTIPPFQNSLQTGLNP